MIDPTPAYGGTSPDSGGVTKRVLYLIPRFSTGGAEKLVLQYAREMTKLGYEVAVASVRGGLPSEVPHCGTKEGGELLSQFEKTNAKLFVGGRNFIRTMVSLRSFGRSWQPDIIHTHVFSADVMGYLLQRMLSLRPTTPVSVPQSGTAPGKPPSPSPKRGGTNQKNVLPLLGEGKGGVAGRKRIVWISTQHNTAAVYGPLRRLVVRHILKKADAVIAVSENVRKSIASFVQDNTTPPPPPLQGEESRVNPPLQGEGRFVVIPNGIDLSPWLAVPTVSLLSEKTLRLAIIGRLEHQKGHDILFQALTSLTDIPWELSIFGAGSLEQSLKRAYHLSSIMYHIRWYGVVSDLPERMDGIDIVIAPSRFEGMSLAVMEAMTAGRLVIASRAAGEGIIEDKKTGIIAPIEALSYVAASGVHLRNNPRLSASSYAPQMNTDNYAEKRRTEEFRNSQIEDADLLAGSIRWANDNRGEARAIGASAREYASQNFSIETRVEGLVKLYNLMSQKSNVKL